ncbi:MAG: DUF3089 domain-containing protein [Prevotella sp.]|nr:DUF3089 domain-containing protein [Candidatus Prevotella equi]
MKKILFVACTLVLSLLSCSDGKKWENSAWNNDSMWYQSECKSDTGKIDVFYIVSTDVLSAKDSLGNVAWQSQLIASDKEAMTGEIAWVEKNMFYDDFNFSAPYYHQFTFDAIWQLDKEQFEIPYYKAVREACEAFDYYMATKNNGRPFILAGFSQGAMMTLEILRHMTDKQFSRMIACYTLGYRLSAQDLKHPHINAAKGEKDRGVVVSFNSTQTREAIWHFVADGAAACINPINWRTDATPATFTFDGIKNEVHIDKQNNVLLVKTDSVDYFHRYYDAATFFGNAGVSPDNLHHWDLLFYAHQIHDNAVKRSESNK